VWHFSAVAALVRRLLGLSSFSTKERTMSVAKIMEITCESPNSFEDAIKKGLGRASETVNNIQGAWVKEQKVLCDNGKIKSYRVDMKVTFVLEGS
jgi:hypothetical protein